MKAEHRKQLQTNALADRVGKFVQTLKTKPQRRTVFYVILGLAAVLALVLFFRYRGRQAAEKSMAWVKLENGNPLYIQELVGLQKGKEVDYAKTNVGKAARFQFGFMLLWDNGIKAVVADRRKEPDPNDKTGQKLIDKSALARLERSVKPFYKELHKECEEDPVWGAEALYCLAVIEETLAIKDGGNRGPKGHLAEAKKLYQQVAEKYKQSVQAQFAEKKAELLTKSLKEVSAFYEQMAKDLRLELPR